MADDPDDLRRQADRYQRLAQRMNDNQVLQALHQMARDFSGRADEVKATHPKLHLAIRSS